MTKYWPIAIFASLTVAWVAALSWIFLVGDSGNDVALAINAIVGPVVAVAAIFNAWMATRSANNANRAAEAARSSADAASLQARLTHEQQSVTLRPYVGVGHLKQKERGYTYVSTEMTNHGLLPATDIQTATQPSGELGLTDLALIQSPNSLMPGQRAEVVIRFDGQLNPGVRIGLTIKYGSPHSDTIHETYSDFELGERGWWTVVATTRIS